VAAAGSFQAVWKTGTSLSHWTNDLFAPGVPRINENYARFQQPDLAHPDLQASTHPDTFNARAGWQFRLIAIAPAHMCRSDGWIGVSSTRTSASPWAKGGVGISVSFNTRFGSPVSVKINALIDTPWALGDGRMFYDFGNKKPSW